MAVKATCSVKYGVSTGIIVLKTNLIGILIDSVLNIKHIEAETNGRHFAGDIFKCIFLNENVWIPIKISLKFVPKGPINNIPLSEPVVVSLLTHICVTRPQ